MGRREIILYFWEELNAFTLNNHKFNDGFKQLVNASIERALIRDKHKGKLISKIIMRKNK
jgi:hypothetical protein